MNILERLRAEIDLPLPYFQGDALHASLCEDAANEIERLRDLLRDARSNCVAGSREDLAWDNRRAEALA